MNKDVRTPIECAVSELVRDELPIAITLRSSFYHRPRTYIGTLHWRWGDKLGTITIVDETVTLHTDTYKRGCCNYANETIIVNLSDPRSLDQIREWTAKIYFEFTGFWKR
jgi:hypothetical protein